jgi:hypothetical protein
MQIQIPRRSIILAVVAAAAASACGGGSSSPESPAVAQSTFNVDSIIGTSGDIDPSRVGFIDLADGVAYSQADAVTHASDIDFAYNFHGGGCPNCRLFENVGSMSGRTNYVENFSTITNSTITNAELNAGISPTMFDAIETTADIEKLFADHLSSISLNRIADITNRVTDEATGRVFAFSDKNGKKGFFRISDYVANVPTGDKATLTLTVKIEK